MGFCGGGQPTPGIGAPPLSQAGQNMGQRGARGGTIVPGQPPTSAPPPVVLPGTSPAGAPASGDPNSILTHIGELLSHPVQSVGNAAQSNIIKPATDAATNFKAGLQSPGASANGTW